MLGVEGDGGGERGKMRRKGEDAMTWGEGWGMRDGGRERGGVRVCLGLMGRGRGRGKQGKEG